MRNIVLISVFVLMFHLNYPFLTWLYPKFDTVQFEQFYFFRARIYETMFLLAVIFFFLNTKGLEKSVSAFGLVIVGASWIDKVIYEIHNYLYSDSILIVVAAVVGFFIYKKDTHAGKDR
jgi:hypothetical protein